MTDTTNAPRPTRKQLGAQKAAATRAARAERILAAQAALRAAAVNFLDTRTPVTADALALRSALSAYEAAVAPPPKQPSRADRWAQAASAAQQALCDLEDVRAEVEEWRDNLPENLQQSALGEKLNDIADLDIASAISTVEEADGLDFPLGFGRD
jgi:hypothetical protein